MLGPFPETLGVRVRGWAVLVPATGTDLEGALESGFCGNGNLGVESAESVDENDPHRHRTRPSRRDSRAYFVF